MTNIMGVALMPFLLKGEMPMDNTRMDCDLNKVLEICRDIKYGTVTIQIQDGKVVFIEKTEKIKING